MISSRAFIGGLLLVVPLWFVIIGLAIGNGALVIFAVFAFVVFLWGLDLHIRAGERDQASLNLANKKGRP